MKKSFVLLTLSAVFIFGCNSTKSNNQFTVKNTLDKGREFETVEVAIDSLALDLELTSSVYTVIDVKTGEKFISQLIDVNQDGLSDKILFQPKIKALEERMFQISPVDSKETEISSICYSRYVPERTDDYAWENDRVAFRTYGPKAQQMIEEEVPGGTLSSGIDAWLKKVDYPIIDKWYKKELETDGTYHEDTGEGLDNFHVGTSRGVGGTAVKEAEKYVFSTNFQNWKRLYNGPIRTAFVLMYDSWDANGKKIMEEKHISLDKRSNLSRFRIKVTGTDTLSVGLTLHENDGEVLAKIEAGFISYWQPHKDSELGTAIVGLPEQLVGYDKYETEEKDLSNVYAHFKVVDKEISYYSGFGWKESGQFSNQDEWTDYLEGFAHKLNHPMTVKY